MEMHHCIICGKSYKFCDSCRNIRSFTPWRTIACSAECYQAYMIILACQRNKEDEEMFKHLREIVDVIEAKEAVQQEIRRLLEEHSDLRGVDQ